MELFNKIMSETSDIIWTYILIAGLIGLGIIFPYALNSYSSDISGKWEGC